MHWYIRRAYNHNTALLNFTGFNFCSEPQFCIYNVYAWFSAQILTNDFEQCLYLIIVSK